jgi:hypothetical protein
LTKKYLKSSKRFHLWPEFECTDGSRIYDGTPMLAVAVLAKDEESQYASITIEMRDLHPVTAEQIYAGLDSDQTTLQVFEVPLVIELGAGEEHVPRNSPIASNGE